MPDDPDNRAPDTDHEAAEPISLQRQWMFVSGAMVVAMRVAPAAASRAQILAYLKKVQEPIRGNRDIASRMPYKDAAKIVQLITRDMLREFKRLAREAGE